jgi:hypothetical protein
MLRSNLLLFTRNRDTSTRPGQVSNPVGSVVLGFIQPDGSGGENLDIGQLIELKYMFKISLITTTRHSAYRQSPGTRFPARRRAGDVHSPKRPYEEQLHCSPCVSHASCTFFGVILTLLSHRAVIGDSGNISPQFTINGS